MSAKAFNPNRPFGTVTGDSRFAFDQDGQLYDNQKRPVDSNGILMELAAKPAAPVEEPPPVAPVAAGDDDDRTEDEKLDLLAWAKDDPALAATPWQSVRAAAADVLEDISELKSKAALKDAILKHYEADV